MNAVEVSVERVAGGLAAQRSLLVPLVLVVVAEVRTFLQHLPEGQSTNAAAETAEAVEAVVLKATLRNQPVADAGYAVAVKEAREARNILLEPAPAIVDVEAEGAWDDLEAGVLLMSFHGRSRVCEPSQWQDKNWSDVAETDRVDIVRAVRFDAFAVLDEPTEAAEVDARMLGMFVALAEGCPMVSVVLPSTFALTVN